MINKKREFKNIPIDKIFEPEGQRVKVTNYFGEYISTNLVALHSNM